MKKLLVMLVLVLVCAFVLTACPPLMGPGGGPGGGGPGGGGPGGGGPGGGPGGGGPGPGGGGGGPGPLPAAPPQP